MSFFTENWFHNESCDRLAQLARQVDHIPGVIIEIGSWEGKSTCVLANAIRPRIVHAVDTWQGSPNEISAELAAERDVHATFANNVKVLTGGNVVEHRMGWREYMAGHGGPIALVFIDAEHTYREVYDTITAVLPFMSPGGVICGDDATTRRLLGLSWNSCRRTSCCRAGTCGRGRHRRWQPTTTGSHAHRRTSTCTCHGSSAW